MLKLYVAYFTVKLISAILFIKPLYIQYQTVENERDI